MQVVVYTANINNYDVYRTPLHKEDGVRYILFTDDPNYKSDFWEVKYVNINLAFSDPQRKARFIKLNAPDGNLLPPHDISIWVDSSIDINIKGIREFAIKSLGNKDVACFRHGNNGEKRICIYDEATACIKRHLDSEFVITEQMIKYSKLGFPINYGLFATGVLIRRNIATVRNFSRCWWEEIMDGSKRDQLSQVFASWKTSVWINDITIGGESIYHNQFFIKNKHLQKRVK